MEGNESAGIEANVKAEKIFPHNLRHLLQGHTMK